MIFPKRGSETFLLGYTEALPRKKIPSMPDDFYRRDGRPARRQSFSWSADVPPCPFFAKTRAESVRKLKQRLRSKSNSRCPFPSRVRNDITAFLRAICQGRRTKFVAVFENLAAQKP